MDRLVTLVRWLARAEDGQDLLEYAMLCALIALVAIGAVTDSRQQDQHGVVAGHCCFQHLIPSVLLAVVAGSGTAAAIDLRTGQIPNPLTAGVAGLGLALTPRAVRATRSPPPRRRRARVRADAAGPRARRHRRRRREAARGARHAARTRRRVDGVSLQRDRGRPARRRACAQAPPPRRRRSPGPRAWWPPRWTTKKEIDGAAAHSRFAYGPAIAIGAIAAALLVR